MVRERCGPWGFDPGGLPAGARGVAVGVDMGAKDARSKLYDASQVEKEAEMALRKAMERLTKPIDELDREALGAYCDDLGVTPMDRITPRTPTRVAGEIRAVRIVPRAGAPAVEVTVTDGRGTVIGVFLGRRKIPGMSPGRRVVLGGVAGQDGGRYLLYNPEYELLA
jgi:hypothetical protein